VKNWGELLRTVGNLLLSLVVSDHNADGGSAAMRTNERKPKQTRIYSVFSYIQYLQATEISILCTSVYSERPRVQVPSTPIATVRNLEGGGRNGAGRYNYRTLHVLSLESEIVYIAT
jgi:hypothetical protein